MGGVFYQIDDFQEAQKELHFNPGIIFIVLGIGGFILLVVAGILNIMASKHIGQVRKYNFILIVSIINCLTGILGILLGVFAIIEINKGHVKALFEQNKVGEIPE